MQSHLGASLTTTSKPSLTTQGNGEPQKSCQPGGASHAPSFAHALKSLNVHDAFVLPEKPAEAMSDTPNSRSTASTAPGSPRLPPLRRNSGSQTPRVRPHATTLNIPGMTRSRVSPDGRIAQRDVAAKLVVIMVGLPARGKSYITKKIQRYLSWQQHNTKIFNVGSRRRIAARRASDTRRRPVVVPVNADHATQSAALMLEGPRSPDMVVGEPTPLDLNAAQSSNGGAQGQMDQSANFFDPNNETASKLREQLALDTLDELLNYLINQDGAVGILDATNSSVHRREMLVRRVKALEPNLGILFIESISHDKNLLEANMRLKLSGPDYKDKDPVRSLKDFKLRVKAYESAYEPLGKYEEDRDLPYIQMIDAGRKVIQHNTTNFLSHSISSYIMTFNLSARQIWITRHGHSVDNELQKLGGDSELTERGHCYGEALYAFITERRKDWMVQQKNKLAQSTFPPQAGDHTPPYPELNRDIVDKNFCVWTSMLKRSIQTAEYFEADDDYDVKNWDPLNELNAGSFEGMTYDEIATKCPGEYRKREADKLHYMYPGVGGEGYLSVINRLRGMVGEIERITDHVLIISHRSVCRVLLAYFMDLTRDDIADLDMPLGMLYAIEPKPYGIEFHAYKYDERRRTFKELRDYKPTKTMDRNS